MKRPVKQSQLWASGHVCLHVAKSSVALIQRTNAVSDRFISAAMRCIDSSARLCTHQPTARHYVIRRRTVVDSEAGLSRRLLGDGPTPSCWLVIHFHHSTVKHALQNTQNDCHQWLYHSFRVCQIRFRSPGARWRYSAPPGPRSGLREPYF